MGVPREPPSKGEILRHPLDTTVALVPSRVMKWHFVTSEVETKLSIEVVLPNGEFKALGVLVHFGCQAVALANPNVFGDQISEKYESLQRRRLFQADNNTPLPGRGEQIDIKISFTALVDGSVSLPRVAQNGVSPYLVPNLPWDMALGHPWGDEHCVSHFARFNCSYSHHPVHPRFWIEDFREAPRTSKRFLVKRIHGKVSRESVWGITVPIIGAVTPMHPAPAIVVMPPGGEPPNRVEAEKHISYALTASSLPPYRIGLVRWSSLNLVPGPLPVMFYLHGAMARCGSRLTMASRHIGPHPSKINLAKTPTWMPSMGSRVWLRLPVGFRHSMISFPPPRTHPNCIRCALPIIGFRIVFGKFGKKNYEPSS